MGYKAQTTYEYTRTKRISFVRGTLHPYILAGIMTSFSDEKQYKELIDLGLDAINLIFINSKAITVDDRMSSADILNRIAELQIGGPALLRWTLKQWKTATAVVDPSDYFTLIEDLKRNNNTVTSSMRLRLLRRAMQDIEEKDKQTAEIFHRLWPIID
jgi:phosphoribosylaminoimidazolecarboxamide formyltransferase/IMP cyclohydrolase